MSDKNTSAGLKLLNDSVFDPKTGKDAFNHGVYAKLLAKIFSPSAGNDPGISVALFGKWGQGKSSVVHMMEDIFEKTRSGAHLQKQQNVKVIWFNAWKTRGDHVRRQLLLSIIKGIGSPRYAQISKFIQPGNPLVIRPYCVQEEVNKSTHWWVMAREEKIDPVTAAIIIIGVLSFILWVISFFISSWTAKFSAMPLLSFVGSCMAFCWRFFSERKTQLLTSAEPVSDSQRLKYPDQFQQVFEEELAEYKKRDGTPLVVVVDDLDRCEAGTVVEALACIRQLGGKPLYVGNVADCRFLVPCDEKQVLSALARDGHHEGYEKEDLLRKFFDIIIRMDDFIPDDMVAYAKTVLNEFTHLTENDIDLIQELIGSVAPRNPRQVKKLVNAYLIFKEKVAALQDSHALRANNKLDHFERTGLLVIALQETVPSVFEQLVESSDEFAKLKEILSSQDGKNEEDADKKRAARIIRALEPVSYHTFSLLTKKGIPETLIGIDNGPDIYDAIRSGNEETFAEEIAKVSDFITVKDVITSFAKDAAESLPENYKAAIVDVLGKDIFKTKTADDSPKE
jgi:hypothetical protein